MRFPVPRANWIPSAVTAVVSLVFLVALGSLTPGSAIAMVIAAAAGMAAGMAATPKKKARPQTRPQTTLVSALQAADGGRSVSDLRGVLAGIAVDESGQIDPSATDGLVAVFGRPEAARDAARRMVSNVEALSRRTGRDLRIAIGIHSGTVAPGDIAAITARLRELTESKRASVIVGSG